MKEGSFYLGSRVSPDQVPRAKPSLPLRQSPRAVKSRGSTGIPDRLSFQLLLATDSSGHCLKCFIHDEMFWTY